MLMILEGVFVLLAARILYGIYREWCNTRQVTQAEAALRLLKWIVLLAVTGLGALVLFAWALWYYTTPGTH